jgi:hypothetical protein
MIRTPLANEYLPLMSALPNPQDIFLDPFLSSGTAHFALNSLRTMSIRLCAAGKQLRDSARIYIRTDIPLTTLRSTTYGQHN